MQKWEKELKMQRPNMALTQKLDLRPNLVSNWGRETVEREEKGRGRKKKKRKKREEPKRYGFYDFWYGIVWIFGFCMKLCVFGPW